MCHHNALLHKIRHYYFTEHLVKKHSFQMNCYHCHIQLFVQLASTSNPTLDDRCPYSVVLTVTLLSNSIILIVIAD